MSQAVLIAAQRAGAALPDAAVTRVARWSATVARGLVAQAEASDDVALLSHGYDHVVTIHEVVSCLSDQRSAVTDGIKMASR